MTKQKSWSLALLTLQQLTKLAYGNTGFNQLITKKKKHLKNPSQQTQQFFSLTVCPLPIVNKI